MAKDKTKSGVPNRHLHARVSYLEQAATHLTVQQHKIGRHEPNGETPEASTPLPKPAADSRPSEKSNTIGLNKHRTGGLPNHLANHLRQVALKSQIRLHTNIKHTLCKVCNTVQVEGETCSKSMENLSKGAKKPHADVLVMECMNAGKKIEDAAKTAFEWTKTTSGHAVTGLQNVKWEQLPENVKEHIRKNPKMTAFQIVSLLVAFVPGLVVAPVLGIMGLSSIGPVAGGAAAAFQSANGATKVFSVLQSAAMGGYGVAAVNGTVTAASFAVGAVSGFFKRGEAAPQAIEAEKAAGDE